MKSQSVLKFINNEINIANSNSEAKSVYAFTFQNINSGTMTFENNCITPNKEYLSDNSEHIEKKKPIHSQYVQMRIQKRRQNQLTTVK